MVMLKLSCNEEGDGETNDSPHVRRAVGLAAYMQDVSGKQLRRILV